MKTGEKRILYAKWFERLGLLAMGSLVFQGFLREGGFGIVSIIVGTIIAIIAYGLAFYLILKT